MMPFDEDAFLPTENDKIKAQIREMKRRMAVASEKHRKLKRQLIEEDISYVVVSKITEGIKDPTRTQAHELEGLQKEIFEQLLLSAEACCVGEIISYHRLGGRTVSGYRKNHFSIRLETFYGKAYKEPYYLLFLSEKPDKVDKHTLPEFIPVDVLGERFLPGDFETFIRILHGCIQAYVTRRELMEEIEKFSENNLVKVLFKNSPRTLIELEARPRQMNPIHISILFENRASSYPTKVVVKDLNNMDTSGEYVPIEMDLMERDIVEVLSELTVDIATTKETIKNISNLGIF